MDDRNDMREDEFRAGIGRARRFLPGAVDVWRIDVAIMADATGPWRRVLSGDERRRADRFYF